MIGAARTVFDTSRGWTARLNLVAKLFPNAKVICCVRDVPWIIDSVELLIRSTPFEMSKIFDGSAYVYTRSERLMNANGLLGSALGAMEQ